jgi:hypothetical protein
MTDQLDRAHVDPEIVLTLGNSKADAIIDAAIDEIKDALMEHLKITIETGASGGTVVGADDVMEVFEMHLAELLDPTLRTLATRAQNLTFPKPADHYLTDGVTP